MEEERYVSTENPWSWFVDGRVRTPSRAVRAPWGVRKSASRQRWDAVLVGFADHPLVVHDRPFDYPALLPLLHVPWPQDINEQEMKPMSTAPQHDHNRTTGKVLWPPIRWSPGCRPRPAGGEGVTG